MQSFNELGCSELSLELGSKVVLNHSDGLDLSIGGIQMSPQIATNPRSADPQLALAHELRLELSKSQGMVSCIKQMLNDLTSPVVELGELLHTNPSFEGRIRVILRVPPQLVHLVILETKAFGNSWNRQFADLNQVPSLNKFGLQMILGHLFPAFTQALGLHS